MMADGLTRKVVINLEVDPEILRGERNAHSYIKHNSHTAAVTRGNYFKAV